MLARNPGLVPIGADNVDSRLGGGIEPGALHELFAATSDDTSTTVGFAALLALRCAADKPLFWVRDDRVERDAGRVYAPGLAELGSAIHGMTVITAQDTVSILRAAADIAACSAAGVVIIEPWARAPELDLTASRRLALAAARSGVMTLIVRAGAEPAPSAAQTRWRVGSAPSRAFAAGAPGLPAFDISLLRHRGGIAGFDTRVEWDCDQRTFRETPLSGGIPALAVFGARDPRSEVRAA